jgi:hypothetical protein
MRLFAAMLLLGGIDGAEKIREVVRRLNVARTKKCRFSSIPKLVRFSGLEDHVFPRPGILWLLARTLITKPTLLHSECLLLEIVYMHGGAGTRLHAVAEFEVVTRWIGDQPEEGDLLSCTVFNGIRV